MFPSAYNWYTEQYGVEVTATEWGELEWPHLAEDDDELPEVTGPAWIVDNVAHYGG